MIRFSKPPLEVQAKGPDGRAFRLIGVHAKSKAPHGAEDPAHVLRLAIENRRKQLAQCIWIRARVEEHLAQGDSLIVLGDFNDGPGLDEFERLFGRSGVEIVLGPDAEPALRLHDPHAAMALQSKVSMQPTTAGSGTGRRNAGSRRCSTSSWCPRTWPRDDRTGASGTRSTTPASPPCPNCARRSCRHPTISR